jgi:hypothetical protein
MKERNQAYNLLATLILATVPLCCYWQSEENQINTISEIDIEKFWWTHFIYISDNSTLH